jgi:sigma-B regulation protein RsbU (phosphoserine phosphatase)
MAARDQERLEKELAQVENARVLRDMELAKQIQLSLLPSTAPTLPGATFSAVCVQATLVGGDYYDFFPQSGDSLDLVIADVSGHSVGAALMMVETRSVLRAQVNGEVTPSLLLADLNRLLYEDLNRAELFISMFYARYDGVRHLLYYANAGHTRPLVFRNGANSCMQLDAEGLILGIQPEVDFEERQIELSPDDVVIFYTDGIIEAQNMQSELYGTERLCRIINQYSNLTPGEIMEQVLTDVRAFAHPLHLEDDVSIIVMKVR